MSKIVAVLIVALTCIAVSQAVVWCTSTSYCQDGYRCCWAPSVSSYTCCPTLYKCCSGGLKCCASQLFYELDADAGITALKSEKYNEEFDPLSD